jgi:hypothetical protein
MAINFLTVQTALYNWAVANLPSGMPVIFYYANAPRPTVSYVTLNIQSVVAVNQDWTDSSTDVNGVVNMKGDRQFTLSIQAYGGDTLTTLENLRTSLQKQTVLDTLRANGIVFYQSLTINDITALVDSRYESRAQLDVLFGIGQVYTDAPGYFDRTVIQEVILNAEGNTVYNKLITIPSP